MHISLCVVPFFIKTLSSNTLVFSVYIEIFIICRDCSTFMSIHIQLEFLIHAVSLSVSC